MHFTANVNTTRGCIKGHPDEAFRRAEARKQVSLFLVPMNADQPIGNWMIPDYLVTESMVDRFSALSAAVVTIERTLNDARMRLHHHVSPRTKHLWNKGPLNEWEGNIAALEQWGYLPSDLSSELRDVFEVRCRYLHSAPITSLETDALRAVNCSYALLRALIGFPPTLFEFGAAIRCRDEQDPLFKVFYKDQLSAEPGSIPP